MPKNDLSQKVLIQANVLMRYTANRTVAADGTIVIAVRPVPPLHVPITNGMTNAQISVAKYSNDRHAL